MKTAAALLALVLAASSLQARPLKVFILAGQSNMEGHAKIDTFDYIGDDPATAPLLKTMRDEDGKPAVCDHVWISYFTGPFDGSANGEGSGKLTAGYGARQKADQENGKIGPEFTFGLTMDKSLQEPVLIIKTAWGGKSLFHDFRPPSAGVYQRTAKDVEKDRYREADCGRFYRWMIEHVKRVLADPRHVVPSYDPAQGFALAGFVWLQGWNDMVDRDVYPLLPKGSQENRFAKYSEVLADFIRDVRKDLDAPKMPFVIGVLGVDGHQAREDTLQFRAAMTAPALLPEFKGNVAAVPTAPFWSEELAAIEAKHNQVRQMSFYLNSKHKDHANADGHMSEAEKREYLAKYEAEIISPAEAALWKRGGSNFGFHYLGCAKTFALMGRAFAEAVLKMQPAEEP